MLDLVQITVPLLREHEHVLCVSPTGSGDDARWLRKREVEAFELTGQGQVFVVLNRQLAAARGLA